MRLFLLLLLLLLLCGLLVVLIVGDIVLIAAISSIGIGPVVLGILGSVVGRACGSRSSLTGWAVRCRRLVLAPVTAIASTVVILTVTTPVPTIIMLGWVLLEPLVLSLDVC